MRNYDFRCLNDKDFEILVCDLLSAESGVRFERFKQGQDSGIDGRYFSSSNNLTILQCKHWVRSTVSKLTYALKSKERPKAVKLAPERYILATSLELSPANKKAIKDAMSPFIARESDIYGSEDINDLLGKHEEIERKHYKLWLSGTKVLQSIFHSAILGRSDFALDEILSKNSRYVTTKVHEIAEKKLEKSNVVIITGEPGVGKTTLAEQLCIKYVKNEFQLVVIGDKIEEAEAVFSNDKLQIFYFDDFLGRNYLSALNRHEDTHIVSFIKRISKDKTKRFVLTSRTNVLNQGKRLTDTFYIAKLERNELEVRIDSLKPYEKAELLYNHVWFAELEINYVEAILTNKRYRDIIEHKNFNPRLISFITDPQRLTNIPAEKYWDYIQSKLNNPADIWEHTYESQLDHFSRAIVLIVVLNGGKIYETKLREAYYRFIEHPIAANSSGINDFEQNIRTLTGSLLNRNIESNQNASLTLFNPSVADYVINRVKSDSYLIERLALAISSENTIKNLEALAEESLFGSKVVVKCLVSLAEKQLTNSSVHLTLHYKMILAEKMLALANDNCDMLELVAVFLKSLLPVDIKNPNNRLGLVTLMSILLSKNTISEYEAWQLLALIRMDDCDYHELEAFASIFPFLSGNQKKEFTENLQKAILEYWKEFITDEIEHLDVLSDYFDFDDAIPNKIFLAVRDLLGQYKLSFIEAQIQLITNSCDIDKIIQNNIKRDQAAYNNYCDYRENNLITADDGIDDLFLIDLPSKQST